VRKPLDRPKLLAAQKLPAPSKNPEVNFTFVPFEKALKIDPNSLGKNAFLGIAFVTDIPGLDVTHTGFLMTEEDGKLTLRHASQLAGKVADMDFHHYLESRRGKCAGVVIFEFLTP
jgi:hypothetical protein